MKRKEILNRFSDLNVNTNKEERAVNKPLLVLYAIGKLINEGTRELIYIDIKEDLENLLKEFGPHRDNYLTGAPFWGLHKDKIFYIPNADKIREGKRPDGTSTSNPKIGDLNKHGVGGFITPIGDKLERNHRLAYEVAINLLDSHFPADTYHQDILQAVGIFYPTQVRISRPRDSKFRSKILNLYDNQCAVCGFQVRHRNTLVALEAAHIKWHRHMGPDIESNGIALCSLHHKLFDRGVFGLSLDWEVLVSKYAKGSEGAYGFQEYLLNFDRQQINLPESQENYPNQKFIEWHTKEVFKEKIE